MLGILIIVILLWVNFMVMSRRNPQQDPTMMLNMVNELRRDLQETNTAARTELQQNINLLSDQISRQQQMTTQQIFEQYQQNTDIIRDITDKLVTIEGTNKQVLSFTEGMSSLENILKNPKQRGILGEYFLETLLANVLAPAQYKMQYSFSDGEIVDAAIFFRDKIIPIDSKFSLEKYNQMVSVGDPQQQKKLNQGFRSDVKKRIDETSKYVRPYEGTTDFAFMFLPAEGIYYDLLVYNVRGTAADSINMIEYAFSKRVIIVSPTSFYAYLETVLQGLKALKIEESVKEVIKKVELLGRHLVTYEDNFNKLGAHIGTLVNSYNRTSLEYKKIDKDIMKITDGDSGGQYDHIPLEKPRAES